MSMIERVRDAISQRQARKTLMGLAEEANRVATERRTAGPDPRLERMRAERERDHGTAIEALRQHIASGGDLSPLLFTKAQRVLVVVDPNLGPVARLRTETGLDRRISAVAAQVLVNVLSDPPSVAKQRFESGLPADVAATIVSSAKLDERRFGDAVPRWRINQTKATALVEIVGLVRSDVVPATVGLRAAHAVLAEMDSDRYRKGESVPDSNDPVGTDEDRRHLETMRSQIERRYSIGFRRPELRHIHEDKETVEAGIANVVMALSRTRAEDVVLPPRASKGLTPIDPAPSIDVDGPGMRF